MALEKQLIPCTLGCNFEPPDPGLEQREPGMQSSGLKTHARSSAYMLPLTKACATCFLPT